MSLTEDDKKWILGQLGSLATRDFVHQISDHAMKLEQTAATKSDLQQLKDDLERVETSLLTEFHKWASPF